MPYSPHCAAQIDRESICFSLSKTKVQSCLTETRSSDWVVLKCALGAEGTLSVG
jgi:hypothetical protein